MDILQSDETFVLSDPRVGPFVPLRAMEPDPLHIVDDLTELAIVAAARRLPGAKIDDDHDGGKLKLSRGSVDSPVVAAAKRLRGDRDDDDDADADVELATSAPAKSPVVAAAERMARNERRRT